MDVKYNIFYLSEDQGNTSICQYMSLNNFITHLKRQQFYVRRKNLFEDVNEKNLPIKLLFRPTEANIDKELSSAEKMQLTSSVKIQSEKFIRYNELSNGFVSCWTLNNENNNLMWETYASKYGVCVISTVYNFIASFKNKDFQDYDVYCAPVSYREPSFSDDPEDLLFVKRPRYRMESELRFLFSPKNQDLSKKDNIWLPYEPKVMIHEIVLSPFWSSQAASFIKTGIEDQFGIKVRLPK